MRYTSTMRENKVDAMCAHCSQRFTVHAYRIKNGTGKYCTHECYIAHRWGKSGTCKQCGKACESRFCSPTCQKTYWNLHGYRTHKHASNWKRKFRLIESLGGQCVKCGFADYRALDINHIDPTAKRRPKGGSYTWPRRFSDWAANAGNLELLCANCHRLHTWEQRGFGPRDSVAE